MNPVEEVIRTRRQLVLAALQDAAAEYGMAGLPTKAMRADDVLAIAARNHARAVEALPAGRRPKGWDDNASDRGAA